ncbi:HAD family hydrolase [Desulfococcus sp.]|uniref:HAD family hydrolase n=1 Tax=Desulfococcus sp. TaxID=2025834 RepID=UPI003593C2D1
MIEIDVPGYKTLRLSHLVLDYNGTLAVDGRMVDGVKSALHELAKHIEVHVITADTFGKAGAALAEVPCRLSILSPGRQDEAKLSYVRQLGAEESVCMGNGRNDRLMLKAAALGVAVMLAEGVAAETLAAADIVCGDIVSALALLSNPLRVAATLRS